MKKKEIFWLTSEFFLQVDLPLLKSLSKIFNITWCIHTKNKQKIDSKRLISFSKEKNIELVLIENKYNRFHPLSVIKLLKILRDSRRLKSDIFFINAALFPYLGLIIPFFFLRSKVILAMHHGKVHRGMRFAPIYKMFLFGICKYFKNFIYYSRSQEKYFPSSRENKNVEVIPLALNDFGKATISLPKEKVHFFNFGHIIKTKNIGLLIRASCLLYEEIGELFHITIVGNCPDWQSTYEPLIKYPKLFTIKSTAIPDNEIPNLFCSNHYLVLPYSAMTQSGPLRIAYGYNVPVVASDLEGFRESIVEGVTGFMFENNNIEHLKDLMKELVVNHSKSYEQVKQKQKKYVDNNFTHNSIIQKYTDLFNKL